MAPTPHPGGVHWKRLPVGPFFGLGRFGLPGPCCLISISRLGKGKLRQGGEVQPRPSPPAPPEPRAPEPGPADSAGRGVRGPGQPAAHSPPPPPPTSGCRARAGPPPPRPRPSRSLRAAIRLRGWGQSGAPQPEAQLATCAVAPAATPSQSPAPEAAPNLLVARVSGHLVTPAAFPASWLPDPGTPAGGRSRLTRQGRGLNSVTCPPGGPGWCTTGMLISGPAP